MVQAESYNVHIVWPDIEYEKICVTAFSKDDTLNDMRVRSAIHSGAYAYKVIGPLGVHKTTPKQLLAHQYRSCIGAACMLEKNIESTFSTIPQELGPLVRAKIAKGLALKQVAKVKRDIADMFKLMGLKIKHG